MTVVGTADGYDEAAAEIVEAVDVPEITYPEVDVLGWLTFYRECGLIE